jgi:hypothetical protein
VNSVIWWFGLVHVVAYSIVGMFALAAYLTWRAGRYGRFLKDVIEWRVARYHWDHRHKDGLTDDEWKRGEPRP